VQDEGVSFSRRSYRKIDLDHYHPVWVREPEDKLLQVLKLCVQQINSPFDPDVVLPTQFFGWEGKPKIYAILFDPNVSKRLQVDDVIFDSSKIRRIEPLFRFHSKKINRHFISSLPGRT
jgi:hypothetical protein